MLENLTVFQEDDLDQTVDAQLEDAQEPNNDLLDDMDDGIDTFASEEHATQPARRAPALLSDSDDEG